MQKVMSHCVSQTSPWVPRKASAELPEAIATHHAMTPEQVLPGNGAAELLTWQAATLYDNDQPCAAECNAAKYLGAEIYFDAATRAVRTHGGFGYAKEYHVERYLRESFIPRIAPVSRELILSFIAERVLGLPKSY